MSDFRVSALQEAQRCLRFNSEQNITQLEFWANLLGAIANAAIASVPDSVASGLLAEKERERAAREHLRDALR